jgi:transposase
VTSAAEVAAAAAPAAGTTVGAFTRSKPVRAPFPAHLPRERVVVPAPTACPCCGGTLANLGETITETLEVVPRQWKRCYEASGEGMAPSALQQTDGVPHATGQ